LALRLVRTERSSSGVFELTPSIRAIHTTDLQTAIGIYIKTTLFTVHDQIHNTYPEWGDGFDGFAKRFGTRQAEFIIQNSVISLGNGLLGWAPRYDRCRREGFWLRTRHTIIRNFVTYDRTEKSLRPQLFPYLGAFVGSVTATARTPGASEWQVRGVQGLITQDSAM
jgi:hypothetical protein